MTLSRPKTVADLLAPSANCFDFIRLAAAACVLLYHCWPLVGRAGDDPFLAVTHLTLGAVGVHVFFIISGFLIPYSCDRARGAGSFVAARALRILPGLAGVLLVSTFIVGPLVTTQPLAAYFGDPATYHYLTTLNVFQLVYGLPGVFVDNPLSRNLNGSLWTLAYEVSFYGIVLLMGRVGALTRWPVAALALGCLLLSHLPAYDTPAVELFKYFSQGMVLYAFREAIPLSRWAGLGVWAALLLSVRFGCLREAFLLGGAYAVMSLGAVNRPALRRVARHGDFSYGLYIYAFPVQQTIVHLTHARITPLQLFCTSLPVTLLCAVLSWRFVEAPAMAWKRRLFSGTRTVVATTPAVALTRTVGAAPAPALPADRPRPLPEGLEP